MEYGPSDAAKLTPDLKRLRKGDAVKWWTSRKPLGVIVHFFTHKDVRRAIVEKTDGTLVVVNVSDDLQIVT